MVRLRSWSAIVRADEIFVLLLVFACVILVVVVNRQSKRHAEDDPSADSTRESTTGATLPVSGAEQPLPRSDRRRSKKVRRG